MVFFLVLILFSFCCVCRFCVGLLRTTLRPRCARSSWFSLHPRCAHSSSSSSALPARCVLSRCLLACHLSMHCLFLGAQSSMKCWVFLCKYICCLFVQVSQRNNFDYFHIICSSDLLREKIYFPKIA